MSNVRAEVESWSKERICAQGVLCILTIYRENEEYVVLTSVPEEDYAQGITKVTKIERQRGRQMSSVRPSMLTFPGGVVDIGQNGAVELPVEAIKREIGEEVGITIDPCRLRKISTRPFTILQDRCGVDKPGHFNFKVLGFVYELSEAELAKITELMNLQDQSVHVLTIDWAVE